MFDALSKHMGLNHCRMLQQKATEMCFDQFEKYLEKYFAGLDSPCFLHVLRPRSWLDFRQKGQAKVLMVLRLMAALSDGGGGPPVNRIHSHAELVVRRQAATSMELHKASTR